MPDYYEKNNKAGILICKINKKTKNGKYIISKDSWQRRNYKSQIQLNGFNVLPSGLSSTGKGLTHAGGRLFAVLGQAPIMEALLFTKSHTLPERCEETLLFETLLPSLEHVPMATQFRF